MRADVPFSSILMGRSPDPSHDGRRARDHLIGVAADAAPQPPSLDIGVVAAPQPPADWAEPCRWRRPRRVTEARCGVQR